MKKIYCFVFLCLFLSGCVLSSTKIINYISQYRGQDIENVIAILGYPDNEQQFKGKKIYIWSNSGMQYMPNFNFNPYGVSNTYGGHYVQNKCLIKIVTDRYNRILDVTIDGDEIGCYAYTNGL